MAHSPLKIFRDLSRPSTPRQGHQPTLLARGSASVRLLCLFVLWLPGAALAARSCDEWHAELVSVEGSVELRTERGWEALQSGGRICTGDSIRVKSYSRAALRLPDKTVLRLDQDTSLTFAEPEDDSGSWLNLLRGVIHVISRDPRALRFNTPYANAGLEGTEFVIAVTDDGTDVTVLEGEVSMSNESGAIGVPSGQRGSARRAQAPRAELIPDPLRVIGWTPHHVPVLEGELPRADQAPAAGQAADPDFYVRRGARRLAVGRPAEAREDLDHALRLDAAGGAEARALLALAALADRNRDEARTLARAAISADSGSAAAWLALSYVLEADLELDEAADAAAAAVRAAPHHAFALARLAELRLARGHHSAARDAADRALQLAPDNSHAHTVLGFAGLRGGSSGAAAAAFRDAIRFEPGAPLPRLGLGLALARQGELTAAREQVEIAVVLDPTDALSRSYMAKIYDTERRASLSGSQLDLAKDLESTDPTAWLYDALRKQAANRPVEALRDLQTAIDLNDSHAMHRSTLRIDEDLGARSAGLGRLHSALGFEQLALLQGWNQVTEAPADYSGHRLLADVYSYLPRHQIARVNELFQSQLLQPLNMTPVRPQLAEANLFILDTAGPSDLAFHEFQPLLQSNGLMVQGSAVSASHGTRGFDASVAGLHDKVSYSIGHFDFRTDGFRPNNDLDRQVSNAYVQFRPRPGTGVSAELRASRVARGDLQMLFDPQVYNTSVRQQESVDSVRLGLRQQTGERGTLLAAFVSETSDESAYEEDRFEVHVPRRGHSVDVQYIHDFDRWDLVSGGKYLSESVRDTITAALPVPPFGNVSNTTRYDLGQTTTYAYGHIDVAPDFAVTVGASLDRVDARNTSRSRLNPKLGLTWQAGPKTSVRAAAFRTLQGPFLSRFNIRPSLEPTNVRGLNQQYFGSEAELAWRYGVAVDHRLRADTYIGAEVSQRDIEVPLAGIQGPPVAESDLFDSEEHMARAYLYWTPSDRISTSFAYQYEQIDNHGAALSNGLAYVRTHRLPVEVNYFHPSGFSAGLSTTFVDQAGRFTPGQFGIDPIVHAGEDRFRVTDLSLGYRLPSRRGEVSLNVHNLFDEEFRFQDTDPENPHILPERMVMLKLTVSY